MNSVRIDVDYPPAVDLRANVRPSTSLSASNATFSARSGDKNFIYEQHSAENVWIIQHSLNKYPSVTIIDSGGNVCIGDIRYVSVSEVRCYFSAPFAGKAYLN